MLTLTTEETRSKWISPLSNRAVPAVALAGVCAAAAFTELSAEEGQVLCPYRLATGGWCPGCGCTRALRHLMHGEVRTSFVLNPWMMLLLAQAMVVSGFFLVMPDRAKTWWKANDIKLVKANLALAAAIWAVRLAWGVIPLPFT